MSRDKIVLEIAKDLCASYGRCTGCNSEGNCDVGISAQVIYDCGYRKRSEGKWVKATPYSQEYCNQCGLTPKTIFGKLPPFCPNCGAKMKGEHK